MFDILKIAAEAEDHLQQAGNRKKHHLADADFSDAPALPVDSPINELLTRLETKETVLWVTNNAWNQKDLLCALARKYGPLESLFISTYACSEDSARAIMSLRENPGCPEISLIIDNRVETRTAGSLQYLKANATHLALAPCHAKVTVIRTRYCGVITICGSANYTENRRYEAGFVSKAPHAADLHLNWINDALHQRTTGTDNKAGRATV